MSTPSPGSPQAQGGARDQKLAGMAAFVTDFRNSAAEVTSYAVTMLPLSGGKNKVPGDHRREVQPWNQVTFQVPLRRSRHGTLFGWEAESKW